MRSIANEIVTNIQIICKLQSNFPKPQGDMKKYIYILFLLIASSGCTDDLYQDYNLIPDIVFSVRKTLTNDEFNEFIIAGVSGYAVYPELGHRGIIVYYTGFGEQSVDEFLAFDLACPHIEVPSCANPMDISSFPEMTNACQSDGIFYRFDQGFSYTYTKKENENGELVQAPVDGVVYDLQQYRVDRIGPREIRITNF